MPDDSANALLLSAQDVCDRLRIGLSHLHAMKRCGKFPLQPIRLGRAVRFRADELAAWIAAGCPTTDRWRAIQSTKMKLTG
jgi:predicted DNA-binding transcriptional regulator AlpA